jgi:hypothetical protein
MLDRVAAGSLGGIIIGTETDAVDAYMCAAGAKGAIPDVKDHGEQADS